MFPENAAARNLEELDPDAGEHELQQRGDDHDVPDGPDGHKHALDHMLQDRHNKETSRSAFSSPTLGERHSKNPEVPSVLWLY